MDDDPSISSLLDALISRMGFDTETTLSSRDAAEKLKTNRYDVLVTDLMMPGFNGLQLAEMALKRDPELMVIVITGHASLESGLAALRLGVYDYILKPFTLEKVEHTVLGALEKKTLKTENQSLKKELSGKKEKWEIIGKSDGIERVFNTIRKAAPTQTTILITGESGTGKELVAKAIHRYSDRSSHPFISVNCGAIPENLLESDLFGHKRGAFTDAKSDHVGRFVQANHGTLFLDEIGIMPTNLQVKLLRAIQEREVRPLGASRAQNVNVRIVAASNADLRSMIKTGEFREDLYYRLNVIPIQLPPLRDRKVDIPLLIEHFIAKHGPSLNASKMDFSEKAVAAMQAYHWPGNIRQLENVVECCLALSPGGNTIDVHDLPPEISGQTGIEQPRIDLGPEGLHLEKAVANFEKELIQKALEASKGVKTRAAKLLNLKRTTLIEKMKRYEMMDDANKPRA